MRIQKCNKFLLLKLRRANRLSQCDSMKNKKKYFKFVSKKNIIFEKIYIPSNGTLGNRLGLKSENINILRKVLNGSNSSLDRLGGCMLRLIRNR